MTVRYVQWNIGLEMGEAPKGREKVLKFNRPQAGGFLGLTGPWGPKVVVAPF